MPTTLGGEIRALGGDGTVLYAGTSQGRLFRHVLGQSVTEVTSRTNTGGVVGLWVSPTGGVFVATTQKFSWCTSACELGASYTDVPASDLNDFHTAVCGVSSSEVYVPGVRGNNVGVLYRWNGQMLQKVSNDLGVTAPGACVVVGGAVHIAAQKHFARFEQNSVTVELADLSTVGGTAEQNQHYWYGIGTLGSQLVGVGSRQRIAMRQTNGAWSMPFNPQAASATLYVVGGPSANEGYALGTVSSTTINLITYASGTWMRAANDLPFLGPVRAMFVAGPNEMYLGGADGSGAPTLVRARR